MSEQGRRPDDRVVVPDDVLAPGQGPVRPGQPSWRGSAPVAGRAHVPIRFWFLGLILAGALLILGTSGIRTWWAHRLHDVTGGSKPADYVLGLVIGALPLAGIAIGRLGTRGVRRVMRMFILGAAGFCVSYLLSPSLSRFATDTQAGRVFDQQAPGYVAGILTAEALWLVVLAVAWWRLRRWRRNRWATRRQGPA
ncbi:MAG TPA: hypothetical protein VFH66_04320 [Mycobacteriales bacterium]|nr:hypothetical protein [Mycobacteriales bacterium]